MPAAPVPVPGWPGGEGRQRSGGTGSPLRLAPGRSFALLCVAVQGAGVLVRRWSWTMATACCWVSREPAENA